MVMKENKAIRILFIGSSDAETESAIRLLRKNNTSVSHLRVDKKSDFLKSLEEFKPDIVLSDLQIQKFSGTDALKLTLNYSNRIPFIFLTDSTNFNPAIECMKDGASDYILKDDLDRLPDAINEAIEKLKTKDAFDIAMQEILSSEEKYRALFKNNQAAYLIVDLSKQEIVDANSAAFSYFGYTSKEILGKKLSEILIAENENLSQIDKICQKKKNSFLVQARLKSGEIREVEISCGLLIKNKTSSLIYLLVQDLVLRIHSNRALNKSLDFQKLLIHLATEFINTPIEKVDDAINKALEASGSFVGADRAYTFEYNMEKGEMNNTYEWCASGVSKEIDKLQQIPFNKFPGWVAAHKKGEIIYIKSVAEYTKDLKLKEMLEDQKIKSLITLPMMYHDECIGFIGFDSVKQIREWTEMEINLLSVLAELITNVEVRKQNIVALKESENLLKIIAEATGTVIYRLRFGDMKYEYIHPAIEQLTGYTHVEMNKVGFASLVQKVYSPDGKEINRTAMKEKREEGKTESAPIDYLIKTKLGNNKWLSDRSFLVKNDAGEIYGSIGILTDITLRKEAEEEVIKAKERAEEINRLKTNFLTNMSHELRTPLVGILGAAQILEDELKNSAYKEWVDIILQAGNRLLETQGLILDFSKIEAEKITPKFFKVPLNDVITAVANLFESIASKKGLFLKVEVPDLPFYVKLDERLLREVLSNLVNNAIKYTRKGGVTINLSEENEYVVIKVIDTGIGIPEDKFEYIFEEFRQVSEGIGRGFEGSGLGLTITKRFVELMRGIITVESILGKGSIFTVKLPTNIPDS